MECGDGELHDTVNASDASTAKVCLIIHDNLFFVLHKFAYVFYCCCLDMYV